MEDDEEFKKAVDSFDEIFQSESRTDIQRASRKSGKRNPRKFGKDSQPPASEENDEEEVMNTENGELKKYASFFNYIQFIFFLYAKSVLFIFV